MSSHSGDPHFQPTKVVVIYESGDFMKSQFPGLRMLLDEALEFDVGIIPSTPDLTHFKTANNVYFSYTTI